MHRHSGPCIAGGFSYAADQPAGSVPPVLPPLCSPARPVSVLHGHASCRSSLPLTLVGPGCYAGEGAAAHQPAADGGAAQAADAAAADGGRGWDGEPRFAVHTHGRGGLPVHPSDARRGGGQVHALCGNGAAGAPAPPRGQSHGPHRGGQLGRRRGFRLRAPAPGPAPHGPRWRRPGPARPPRLQRRPAARGLPACQRWGGEAGAHIQRGLHGLDLGGRSILRQQASQGQDGRVLEGRGGGGTVRLGIPSSQGVPEIDPSCKL
mmetsp:Transcript_6314/g.21732  ORF Transcript_6314/g.21732 Transcript_6314/m.21732 type:complete len:263 (+) Transcript_6314:374-1162(+)